MRKAFIFCLSILVIFLLVGCNKEKDTFFLEDKYYGSSDFVELDNKELDNLIENEENFALFVYQPACTTSMNFENILQDFAIDNQISFYKIAFTNIKDTELGKYVKYYPSFVIYKKGKMVDYLDANSDEDTNIYKSIDYFTEWFTTYVNLKDIDSIDRGNDNSDNQKDNQESQTEDPIIADVYLENVVQEENKVNIYFFWGNGCPHCEQEFEFFKTLKEDYGDRYNLYTFEVWYDEENKELLNTFASAMGDKVSGVPYTVIGNKSFSGFKDDFKKEFENAINSQYKDSYDVYFDKLKK